MEKLDTILVVIGFIMIAIACFFKLGDLFITGIILYFVGNLMEQIFLIKKYSDETDNSEEKEDNIDNK